MNAASQPRLSDAERLDWLRLIRTENVGPRTFKALLSHYRSAARALEVLPDLAQRGGRSVKITTRAQAEAELAGAHSLGVRVIASVEAEYPAALAATDTAPPLIAVRGQADVLQRPVVAIVGSRNASAAGLLFTERLALGLARAGFVVASGLARGIDKRAHEATLATGTVAVLAGGHDKIYPSEHEPLLHRILAQGAAISEMPLGWDARGRDFPRRNRIVAGIALGTVVVEAARRSGSLITARLANEQGRDVFAVPGSPLDPRAEGTNDLIRQGATLCTCPEDVIDALLPIIDREASLRTSRQTGRQTSRQPGRQPGRPPHAADVLAPEPEEDLAAADAAGRLHGEADNETEIPAGDTARRITALLGPAPVGIDDIARAAGAPVREVQQVLLELELAGRLTRHGGNLVSRLP